MIAGFIAFSVVCAVVAVVLPACMLSSRISRIEEKKS